MFFPSILKKDLIYVIPTIPFQIPRGCAVEVLGEANLFLVFYTSFLSSSNWFCFPKAARNRKASEKYLCKKINESLIAPLKHLEPHGGINGNREETGGT